MKNEALIEWLKDLWIRLTGKTSPFFVRLRNLTVIVAVLAGTVWALSEADITFLPEKWTEICGKISGIALAIGITSQATKP